MMGGAVGGLDEADARAAEERLELAVPPVAVVGRVASRDASVAASMAAVPEGRVA